MADSFNRFRVYTGFTGNIADVAGQSVEEIKLQHGVNLPKSVVETLMPKAVVRTQAFLGLGRGENHPADVVKPLSPVSNPFQGPERLLFPMRRFVTKLGSAIVATLGDVVDTATANVEPPVTDLMRGSLKKVKAAKDLIDYLNGLATYVLVRMQQKG